jgi:hypothetical protein
MPCPSHPLWLDHSNYSWQRRKNFWAKMSSQKMEEKGLEIEMCSTLIIHVFICADMNENIVALK